MGNFIKAGDWYNGANGKETRGGWEYVNDDSY